MSIAVWSLFIFVAVGSKVLLALVTIYLLLPGDQRCSACDHETLLMQSSRTLRLVCAAAGGRVERRWCPRCGWDGMAKAPRRRRWTVPVRSDPAAHGESSNR